MSTRVPAWLPPALVGTTGAVLFGLTWTPAIQAADNGELVTAACNGGVPHPPGYPLFVLVGHAFCALPISTPAGRVALLSVVAAVCAVLALYGIVVRLTGNRWAAAVAALTLATGRSFWRCSSYGEVFALNAALCLAAVYAALRVRDDGRPRLWSALAGLLAGLGLSNHHSSAFVLLAPAVAVALPLRPLRQAALRSAAALAGLAAGLLPYLYLLLARADRLPRWGDTSTWAGLWHHVLRTDYGTLSLSFASQPAPLENLTYFLSALPHQLGWALAPVALLGLAALVLRARGRTFLGAMQVAVARDLSATLIAIPLLGGPLFLLLFNIAPESIGAQVVERFHVLPSALLCIWLGVGLAAAHARWLAHPGRIRRARLWHGASWAVLAVSAMAAYPHANLRQSYAVEDYARNLLASVDENAMVLGRGDAHWFATLYVQQMLGVRRDVQYVDAGMLNHSWYVAQKQRERPTFSFMSGPSSVNTIDVIRRAMGRGIPVYLAVAYNDTVVASFPGYPAGPLFRLLPPARVPPTPRQAARLNERLFAGFIHRGRLPDPAIDPWAASLAESYAQTWRELARGLHRTGDAEGARAAMARASGWAPWLR